MRRSGAIAALLAVAMAVASPAWADDPPRGHHGIRVALEAGPDSRLWPDAWAETLTLRDAVGARVCVLPCVAYVASTRGFVVEAMRTDRWPNDPPGQVHVTEVLTRPLPAEGSDAWPLAAPGQSVPLVVRRVSRRGSTDVALGLALGGAALGLLALGVQVWINTDRRPQVDEMFVIFPAIPAGGLTLAALIVRLASRDADLEIEPVARPSTEGGVRVSVSPFGVRGSF